MNNEVVERVAKAILKCRFYDFEPAAYNYDLELFFAGLDPQHLFEAADEAREAIRAMRTPTMEMLGSGWSAVSKHKKVQGIARLGPGPAIGESYTAMIDRALA